MNQKLTHFDNNGQAHMVDISDKKNSHREALASGNISMSQEAFNLVSNGGNKKGDVLGIARIAGIMAAKKCADIIPLCHPLPLTNITIDFRLDDASHGIYCSVLVKTNHQTGVEMEALTALNVSLLTIYDMCKAVDKSMVMGNIQLDKKTGGKSGDWNRS